MTFLTTLDALGINVNTFILVFLLLKQAAMESWADDVSKQLEEVEKPESQIINFIRSGEKA